jgi:predicted GH43/DUF377 family glycosyl hydrolase
MWLSYCPVELLESPLDRLPPFRDHHLLATPREPWEQLKVGGGTAPLRTRHGWLTLYHGVSGEILPGVERQEHVHYAAGALLLDSNDPRRILYRSLQPILEPQQPGEREGMIANVVFPTALDQRDEGRVDVYYGMADSRIGVGVLHIPEHLPPLDAPDASEEAAACCSLTEGS